MKDKKRRLARKPLLAAALVILALACTRDYLGAYTLAGSSDAPTLVLGDWVWVNRSAYDIRLPYSERVLLTRGHPRRGELVQVVWPETGRLIFKRVVGLPGDRVSMQDHHLRINGSPLTYTATDRTAFASIPPDNRLGSVIETEMLGEHPHLITYTPGSAKSSFAEVLVSDDHYFVLGDNRDESLDSRAWGALPRQSIKGKVVWQPQRP
jgi:signal peptidase I